MLSLEKTMLEQMLLVFADRYVVIDRDGTYLFAFSNAEGRSSFLEEPESLIGRNLRDLLPPETSADFEKRIEAACSTRKQQSLEYSLNLKNIGEQFFEARFLAIDENRVIIVARNITRRVKALNRENFMRNAIQILNSSLDYHQTLRALLDVMVIGLGDYAVVRILDESGRLDKIDFKIKVPEKEGVLNELIARYSWDNRVLHPGATSVREKKTVLTRYQSDEDIRKIASDEAHFKLMKRLDPVSSIAVPLILGSRVLGSFQVTSLNKDRVYSNEDISFVEEIARYAVVAIDRSLTHQRFVKAAQVSEEILKITSQGMEGPSKKIDYEIGQILSMISQIEDPKLKKMISKSAKGILRSCEEIESKLEDLKEANSFWSVRKNTERTPQQLQHLLEDALSYSRTAVGEKSIEVETDFSKNIASILCNPEAVTAMLREWIAGLIESIPKKGILMVSLFQDQNDVVLTMAAPRSRVIQSEFEISKSKIEALGGRMIEESPGAGEIENPKDPRTNLFRFTFPAFSPN